MLTASTAQAQGYPGGGSGGGYPGGGGGYPGGGGSQGHYDVTYSGGTVTGNPRYPFAPGENHNDNGVADASVNGANNRCTATAYGPLTATFTWNNGGDPTVLPPPAAILTQTSTVSWGVTPNNGSYGTGTVDNGLHGPIVSSQNGQSSTSSQTTVQGAPGQSFQVTCNPSVTFIGTDGPEYDSSISGQLNADYIAVATPVTISLTGPISDSSNNLYILIGQPCFAQLEGIPTTCTVSNLQWTVSGYTFRPGAWHPSSDGSSASPLPLTNPYTFTQSTPNDQPSLWCWDDSQGVKTVSCTATVTPPAGQGAPFTITATQNVNLEEPTYHNSDPVGTVQLNTSCPSAGGYVALYLGVGPNIPPGNNCGILFQDWVKTPPRYSGGTWYRIQQATVSRYGTLKGGTQTASPGTGMGPMLDANTGYMYAPAQNADGSILGNNDSPFLAPLFDTYQEFAVKGEAFDDYIMYTPPTCDGGPGQAVPLAYCRWSWDVNDVNDQPAPGTWEAWAAANTPTGGTATGPNPWSRYFAFPFWSGRANKSF